MSTFTTETAKLWMAMDIGPLWIGRDEDDPLSPASIAKDDIKNEVSVSENIQTITAQPTAFTSDAFRLQTTSSQRSVSPHDHAILTSPESHRPKTYELKPIKRAFADPGIVEVDSELLSEAQKADWHTLEKLVSRCTACKALSQSRLSTVFGTAERTAKLVIVGEAPGRDEDIQGKPFVGKSGELLENILCALGLKRGADVAIINVLKCRPPNNRDPHDNEIAACATFLNRQLELLDPKVVVLSGRIASHALLKTETSTGKLRGSVHHISVNGKEVPTVVTYHPSYLLRSPTEKIAAWRDFCLAKKLLLDLV